MGSFAESQKKTTGPGTMSQDLLASNFVDEFARYTWLLIDGMSLWEFDPHSSSSFCGF